MLIKGEKKGEAVGIAPVGGQVFSQEGRKVCRKGVQGCPQSVGPEKVRSEAITIGRGLCVCWTMVENKMWRKNNFFWEEVMN